MKDPQRLADDVCLQAAFFRLYRLLWVRTVVHAAWILDLAWDDNLAKSQIIAQAATAMLAQANQSQQSVLALLK